MNQDICERLKSISRNGSVIHYSEIAQIAGLDQLTVNTGNVLPGTRGVVRC